MRKNYRVKALVTGLVLGFLLSACQEAFAAFSLSVTPYEGGYDLRFDKIMPGSGRVNKELTVTITSDITKQYRVTQMLLEPLSTVEGSSIPRNSFMVYGLRGTNKYGTLNVEEEVPVMLNRQVLYTSNQGGDSDSFILVYGLLPSPDISSGYYRGRIGFILEPIDSSQEQVTVIMNMSADIEVASTVEIKTATGSKHIVMQADREETRFADIAVNIKGGFGRQFRILQFASEQPVSSEGNLLAWEAINFIARDSQKGTVIDSYTSLSGREEAVYTSSGRGEEDSFIIEYKLGDLTQAKAGTYRTKIKYLLEGIGFGQVRLIDILDLEIENPRIFDLVVTPENQKGTIEFLNLRPTEEPKQNELIFEVKSNAGKQYQITQNLYSELMSKEGEIIKVKYFTLRTESLETKGTLKFSTPEEVRKGNTVLFVSDDIGSADKFKVVYELAPSRDIKSGDYSSRITYSLSEI